MYQPNKVREAEQPSPIEAIQRRLIAKEGSAVTAREVLDAIGSVRGEQERASRVGLLRQACEAFPGNLDLEVTLLRELRCADSREETARVALSISATVPAVPDDCALVQQALVEAGYVEEAIDFARRAIELHPTAHHLLHNHGVALRNQGRSEEALKVFRSAVEQQPYSDASLTMAGSVLRDLGRLEEALEFQGAAVRMAPSSSVALYNLGNTLMVGGELAGAVDAYRKAVELRPDWADLLNNMAAALVQLGRNAEAVPHLVALCKLRPDSEPDLGRLAFALRESNRPGEALELADVLVRRMPQDPKYRLLRGACLVRVGRAKEAVEEYVRAIDLNPSNIESYNSMIYAANYLPFEQPEELFSLYRRFSELVEPDGPSGAAYTGAGEPFPRKMRIGYVSGDFCHHPVTTFIEPVLEKHDRGAFEIFCYYNHTRVDAFTRKLQALPVCWRQVNGLSDSEFCELVGRDKIDVLVDLSGHTTRNRLTAFARKPAPVQVTMVGCMQTTGLRAMDYRITDEWVDPVGMTEKLHSELLVRMKAGAVCFRPHPSAPPVEPLPCLNGKPFTFGSFNNLAKITAPVFDLWAQVLAAVPDARMQIVADSEGFFLAEMQRRGIARERFVVLRRMAEVQYLEAHASVDLILDTFPFNGLTVTANALWMGVPCVTLAGNTSASRAGTALLSRVGLERFAVSNKEEFLETAVFHARHPETLSAVRLSLREKMEKAWADSITYTRELESHFRDMWFLRTGETPAAPVPIQAHAAPVEAQTEQAEPRAEVWGDSLELATQAAEGQTRSASFVRIAPSEKTDALGDLAAEVRKLAESSTPDNGLVALWERFRDVPEIESALAALEARLAEDVTMWQRTAICGALWHQAGNETAAKRCFEVAKRGASSASDWSWFGRVLLGLDLAEEALDVLRNATEQPEATGRIWLTLGCLLNSLNRPQEAEPALRRAIGLSPSAWEAYFALANCLYQKGSFREALRVAQPLERFVDEPKLLLNLSSYYEKCGEIVEAIKCLEKLLEKDPANPAGYMNLGNCFVSLGMLDAALVSYGKGISIVPDSHHIFSNLLHVLTYVPDLDPGLVFAKHREFSRRFEAPLLPHRPHSNNRDPERRLRIAYVSPDLRGHSVSYFVEAMLECHDRSQFEVIGVPSYTWSDEVTQRLRSLCDGWIEAGSMSDESLAETLRGAGIDIVVDLICHSNHSRTLMLARKPAPVQVTMIGMQQTTGLESVDYRVTDAVMDPPGLTEQFHTEKLLRLPVALVFKPPTFAPPVMPLPALENGFITFGSLNNFAKAHQGVRDAWIRVLKAVPNSRFVCVLPPGTGFEASFAEAGIAADRVRFSPRLHLVAYLELHHQMDFVLDTFPFAGLTVSALAAWMGVPTLTIAGNSPSARAGASLQHSLGLDEFIAKDPDDFVEKAVKLASDFGHLAQIRSSMRERMAAQFTNGPAYMRSFEAAMREAWRDWCARDPDQLAER